MVSLFTFAFSVDCQDEQHTKSAALIDAVRIQQTAFAVSDLFFCCSITANSFILVDPSTPRGV